MKKFSLLGILILSLVVYMPNKALAAGNQALLIGRNYGNGDINTTVDVTNASSSLSLAGKTIQANTNPTISWVKGTNGSTKRMESDVLFFSGHGNSSLIHFYNSNHTSGYDFYITTGSNTSTDVGLSSYSMSKVKLAVFAGCKTASGNSNITKTAQSKGAKASIGWIPSIGASSHTSWLSRFWSKVPTAQNLNSALIYADSYTYSDNGVKSYNKYGNWALAFSLMSTSNELNSTLPLITNDVFDERNNSVDINVSKMSDDEINNEIANWITNNINNEFNLKNYEIEKTVQQDKIVLDFKLLINNEIKTKLGYTVFIYDNNITNIFDNLIENEDKIINNVNVALKKSNNKISNLNKNNNIDYEKFEIVSEESYKYYDDENHNVYYVTRLELRSKIDGTYSVKEIREEV